tara:strand:- start:381 stop:497 length:117 start_codon:yes stop_codon:yes gene_type:complete
MSNTAQHASWEKEGNWSKIMKDQERKARKAKKKAGEAR